MAGGNYFGLARCVATTTTHAPDQVTQGTSVAEHLYAHMKMTLKLVCMSSDYNTCGCLDSISLSSVGFKDISTETGLLCKATTF